MNEKTMNQIAEMKKQTIGVEVEMNSITRQNAAKLAAEFFGTGRFQDTARRNGYRTWSAWDAQGREWKFQRDSSIDRYEGFPDFYYKAEMVLPIKGIRTGKVRRRRVFVYIMHEERNLCLPSARYVQVCREGYDAFGFGQRYLTDAIQRSMEGMK